MHNHLITAFYPIDWGSFYRHAVYLLWQLTDNR
jgi:hypothetical protein